MRKPLDHLDWILDCLSIPRPPAANARAYIHASLSISTDLPGAPRAAKDVLFLVQDDALVLPHPFGKELRGHVPLPVPEILVPGIAIGIFHEMDSQSALFRAALFAMVLDEFLSLLPPLLLIHLAGPEPRKIHFAQYGHFRPQSH